MPRIALFQSRSGIDPQRNADALAAAVEAAVAGCAEMLFTPEMTGLLDRDRERSAGSVSDEDHDLVLAAARASARENRLWIHLGSLALRTSGGKLVNRSFLIDSSGEIRARYDKMHLFDVDLPGGESWRESASYEAGTQPVVVRGTPVGALGLTVCYDLRFPALFAALAEAGAETIAVPAAFTVPTGRAHWQILLRARAIEAGLFVVAAAQAGRHEDGRETYGHSLVADPWGQLLIEMGDEPGIAFADIELGRVSEVRARIPALDHRKSIPRPLVVD